MSLVRNPKALAGMIILAFFVLIAIIGPWIAPYNPSKVGPDSLQPPSPAHWLGTTNTGQDILSQLIVGTQGVMVVGLVAGILATIISVIVGVTSGFLGGLGDEVLSLISNVFLVIPALPLIIIIAGLLPSAGGLTIALVIALTGWAWGARVLRAQTLSLRNRDFVEAARANGEPMWRIIFFEIMPNLTGPLLTYATLVIPGFIVAEAALSYLGVGVKVPTASWGAMLSDASSYYTVDPTFLAVPGLALFLTVFAFNLVGDGVSEAFNPKSRR